MNKLMLGLVILLLILGGVYFVFKDNINQFINLAIDQSTVVGGFDPLNTTYTIEGQPVVLINGVAETPITPGSATQLVTKVFGHPIAGDLNEDGVPDAVVILTQNAGGSGTFYYVAAAINTGEGSKGTNGILLGDRISPQGTHITGDQIVTNYNDRNPGEPFSTAPSVGTSKYITLSGSTLSEVQ